MPKKSTKTAKKTTTRAKKKPVEQKVQKLDLSQPFDLSNVSRETLANYAHYLKEMLNSAGWKLLEQVLKGNLAVLEKQIVLKVDAESGEKLSEEETDELRIQHAQITQLLGKPRELIAAYDKKEGIPTSFEYDPYRPEGKNEHIVNAETMSDST